MKTLFKTLLILGLVMVLASLALGIAAIGLLGDLPGVHLNINGEEVLWHSLDLGEALGAGLGLVIAIGALCLVLPLVLLLGVGLPLLLMLAVLALGAAAVLGLGAVLGSPLLVVGVIIWLLVRDRRPRRAAIPPQAAPMAPSAPSANGPAEPSMST
ncbi:hypothetical protein [Roseateles amylovorans]|uniref:DUF4064 domain-containing protein n=1 Tax=Roseateles amylovorans TaxID=2978473 RepID=A0ABY6B3P5_9BURK|nr:hypothetical protein [Roseateles amylovorans]UXH78846.1 hypothetical protein N4261_02580 [Roseateles amylovorans]